MMNNGQEIVCHQPKHPEFTSMEGYILAILRLMILSVSMMVGVKAD